MSRMILRPIALTALALALPFAAAGQAEAACSATGTNQTCTNSTVLPNTASAGITDSGTLTLTNTAAGVIGTGTTHDGVDATNANITNAGAITGFYAINAFGAANVTNSGTITGLQFGVYAYGDINVTNSGRITISTTGGAGVLSDTGNVAATNSGVITGAEYGVAAYGNVNLTNSGSVTAQVAAVYAYRGNVALTNSGSLTAMDFGVVAPGNVNLTNSGSITAQYYGVAAGGDVTATNSGTIAATGSGSAGIDVTGNLSLTNSGKISGSEIGIEDLSSGRSLVITNSGLITGGIVGIYAPGAALALANSGTLSGGTVGLDFGTGSVANSGRIVGSRFGIIAVGTSNVANAGFISGSEYALQFRGSNDTLTLLPGSTIVGNIQLGTNDTIHVNAGNQNLTFTSLAGTTINGTVPYVVSGNRIVSVDATPFTTVDRNMLAVTDAVAGIIGGQLGGSGATPPASSGALGFAGPSYVAANAEEAFADLLGYTKAPSDAVMFNNPSVAFDNGSMIWARGFVGQFVQAQDGTIPRSVTNFYGGMLGVDRQFTPDLKLGGFVGAGHTSTLPDANIGSSSSDLGFGGIYGRKDFGRIFLDFDVMGGGTSNKSSRTINNNLATTGFETATATYGGWFVTPEVAVGYRHDLMPGWTLTPAARLRYLAAGFDGYTETGSTANMTVGSRVAQALEERFEATLTNTHMLERWGWLKTSGTIGVLGQERVGDGSMNAIILGQALAFATPGKADLGGAYLSASADWRTPWGATLFAGADYTVYTDSSTVVTGRAGVKVGF